MGDVIRLSPRGDRPERLWREVIGDVPDEGGIDTHPGNRRIDDDRTDAAGF